MYVDKHDWIECPGQFAWQAALYIIIVALYMHLLVYSSIYHNNNNFKIKFLTHFDIYCLSEEVLNNWYDTLEMML